MHDAEAEVFFFYIFSGSKFCFTFSRLELSGPPWVPKGTGLGSWTDSALAHSSHNQLVDVWLCDSYFFTHTYIYTVLYTNYIIQYILYHTTYHTTYHTYFSKVMQCWISSWEVWGTGISQHRLWLMSSGQSFLVFKRLDVSIACVEFASALLLASYVFLMHLVDSAPSESAMERFFSLSCRQKLWSVDIQWFNSSFQTLNKTSAVQTVLGCDIQQTPMTFPSLIWREH